MTDITSLIQQLYSADEKTRRNATFDLIGGGGAVIEPVIPLLLDDSPDVRYAAALVLDQLKAFVSPRLFTDVVAALNHLNAARARLNERSVEDDKFTRSVILQLITRIDP
jgi:HEAT repeat protein